MTGLPLVTGFLCRLFFYLICTRATIRQKVFEQLFVVLSDCHVLLVNTLVNAVYERHGFLNDACSIS